MPQAGCERNFSTLGWFFRDRRNRLSVSHVESMAKVRSYYLTNIKKELAYYGKDLTQQELRDSVNGARISSIDDHFFESDEGLSQLENQATTAATNNTLVISELIDLTNPSFSSVSQQQTSTSVRKNMTNQDQFGSMNYNTQDLIDRMFEKDGEVDI